MRLIFFLMLLLMTGIAKSQSPSISEDEKTVTLSNGIITVLKPGNNILSLSLPDVKDVGGIMYDAIKPEIK